MAVKQFDTNGVLISDETAVEVTCRPCLVCGKSAVVTVSARAHRDWYLGKFVHQAFPELSPEERELLVSGTHPECWDEMFGY